MRPLEIIARHISPGSLAFEILVIHSTLVARKALAIAADLVARRPEMAVDIEILREIAWLHDIGIVRVHAPEIGCEGKDAYILHGVRGREILEHEGLPIHALACERHTGAGIPEEEVIAQDLPLPRDRDYCPVTIEEKILCVADKFFSKKPAKIFEEKPIEKIDRQMTKWGPAVAARWRALRDEILG